MEDRLGQGLQLAQRGVGGLQPVLLDLVQRAVVVGGVARRVDALGGDEDVLLLAGVGDLAALEPLLEAYTRKEKKTKLVAALWMHIKQGRVEVGLTNGGVRSVLPRLLALLAADQGGEGLHVVALVVVVVVVVQPRVLLLVPLDVALLAVDPDLVLVVGVNVPDGLVDVCPQQQQP